MNKLQKIAEDTIAAIDAEKYTTPSGRTLSLDKLMASCTRRSVLYKPDGIAELEKSNGLTRKIVVAPEIMVTRESTLEAAARLAGERPCILNFASAKHPGGGFLRGSPAQEESIARSSGLFPTLIRHPEFYEENKKSQRNNIGLYLDYAIYSPDVPVIRNDAGEWLEEPYFVSVVTSPAPNRHAIFDDEDNKMDDDQEEAMEMKIEQTFSKRMKQVLSIMAAQGHRTIILGAWGCGVFGNDPLMVAELFRDNLKLLPFFDKVAFPIYDRSDSETLRSFVQIFGPEVDPRTGSKPQPN
ncbi:TIGR02452 family protein [Candidatus Pacearchaeota archaeon]|nr:TIGR02452 family protein [Candidatus Pacearchaeota archaeon]